MAAGELTQPLEVPCMQAEIDGRFPLGPMGGHGIESLRRDDLVQGLMAEVGRPEQLQCRAGKDSIRSTADAIEFRRRITTPKGAT